MNIILVLYYNTRVNFELNDLKLIYFKSVLGCVEDLEDVKNTY